CQPAGVTVRNNNSEPVWIQKHMLGIKTMSLVWVVWAKGTISVDLSRLHSRYKDVPVVILAVPHLIDGNHPRGFRVTGALEQQQIDAGRVFGEHAEVDSAFHHGCTKGRGSSG